MRRRRRKKSGEPLTRGEPAPWGEEATPSLATESAAAAWEDANCGYQPPGGLDPSVVELPRTDAPWKKRKLDTKQNSLLERYYRLQQIAGDDELAGMLARLRRPLPVTFRMCRMATRAAEVEQHLEKGYKLLADPKHLQDICDGNGRIVSPPHSLDWCRGWQINCDKMTLKFPRGDCSEYFSELQKWITQGSSIGLLTRQSVDSMVPAALLEVESHHKILDLCAAPGSKTTQLLELLHEKVGVPPQGCVVANDASPPRAYFLVRRCMALGQSCQSLLITNHKAQKFPHLASGNAPSGGMYYPGSFDRILCDVPCSGDGTLRKNPQIWEQWKPDSALRLHPLQIQIAMRGLALLKVGGLMVYSTCSMNPIENEAVVASLLERCGGAVELVDSSRKLKDLARVPGLSQWKVMLTNGDDDLVEVKSYEDTATLEPGLRKMLRKSMWHPERTKSRGCPLHLCWRIIPQHQDTGGFFVSVLRKLKPLPGPAALKKREKSGRVKAQVVLRPSVQNQYRPIPKQASQKILEEFELASSFTREIGRLMYVRSNSCPIVTYVSDALKDTCLLDVSRAPVKHVWMGVRLFVMDKDKGRYRLTQEAIPIVAPHMRKRTFALGALDMLCLLERRVVVVDQLSPEAQVVSGAKDGSLVVQFKENKALALVVEKNKNSLSVHFEERAGLEYARAAFMENARAQLKRSVSKDWNVY